MYLIQQNTFDIQCSSPSFGKEMQLQLGTLLEKIFYPRLEELFKKYDVPEQHWIIDVLEITIPEIHKRYWKEELVEKMLSQIEAYLARYNPKATQELPESVQSIQSIVPVERKAEVLLFNFLRTGSLPINTISNSLAVIAKEIRLDHSFAKVVLEFFKSDLKSILRWLFSMPEDLRKETLTFLTNPFQQISFSEIALLNKDVFKNHTHSHTSISKFWNHEQLKNQWNELLQWAFLLQQKGVSSTELYHFLNEEFSKYVEVSKKDIYVILEIVHQNSVASKTSIPSAITDFIHGWKSQMEQEFIHSELLANQGIHLKSVSEKTTKNTQQKEVTEYPNYIANAGLVLLHPFLASLFEQLQLTENQEWKSAINQQKGVLLTHYLVYGESDIEENQLLLNKILCGVEPDEIINVQLSLEQHQKEKCQSLLTAVLEHWSIMKTSSREALQEAFLQREGKLEIQDNGYEIWVEEKGYDILLEQLPWGIGMVKTPWMNAYLTCHWNQ